MISGPICFFFFCLFCCFPLPIHTTKTSLSRKRSSPSASSSSPPPPHTHLSRGPKTATDHADLQYILTKLNRKFTTALGPTKKNFPWSRVEIVSGWPRSVYLLEPAHWGIHDIAVLKEAVDSIQMRAKRGDDVVPPLADVLYPQLIGECRRLELFKGKLEHIDWHRLASLTDSLRLTTTNYRRWNLGDRQAIHKLLEVLKGMKSVSSVADAELVNKRVKMEADQLQGRWASLRQKKTSWKRREKGKPSESLVIKESDSDVVKEIEEESKESDLEASNESTLLDPFKVKELEFDTIISNSPINQDQLPTQLFSHHVPETIFAWDIHQESQLDYPSLC